MSLLIVVQFVMDLIVSVSQYKSFKITMDEPTLMPPMFLLPTSHSNDYRLEGRLVGHKNAINCLAVSHNGCMLASGGEFNMHDEIGSNLMHTRI
jgi:hypothetical protein